MRVFPSNAGKGGRFFAIAGGEAAGEWLQPKTLQKNSKGPIIALFHAYRQQLNGLPAPPFLTAPQSTKGPNVLCAGTILTDRQRSRSYQSAVGSVPTVPKHHSPDLRESARSSSNHVPSRGHGAKSVHRRRRYQEDRPPPRNPRTQPTPPIPRTRIPYAKP
jgi:hypothetical protein